MLLELRKSLFSFFPPQSIDIAADVAAGDGSDDAEDPVEQDLEVACNDQG